MDTAQLPLIPAIRSRRSPRAFADEGVAGETLLQLFEAARWAASSFNEQPWRFIIASRHEPGFRLLADCLVEANAWATKAPVLMLSIAKKTFTANGTENRHAWHDVGAAMANLSLQAAELGLQVHQMAGFNVQQAQTACRIPADFTPVAMAALGRPGDPAQLSAKLQASEIAIRSRRPLSDLISGEMFGKPPGWLHAGEPS